jgi:hypothetical protein
MVKKVVSFFITSFLISTFVLAVKDTEFRKSFAPIASNGLTALGVINKNYPPPDDQKGGKLKKD